MTLWYYTKPARTALHQLSFPQSQIASLLKVIKL